MDISQRMNLCQTSPIGSVIILCGVKNTNGCSSAILIIAEEGKVDVTQVGTMDVHWFGLQKNKSEQC